jgi:predicted  nucleic acid-binding Zn-ribbon protein
MTIQQIGGDDDLDYGRWPEAVAAKMTASAADTMLLPGEGEAGEGCGDWIPDEFCTSCGEPQFNKSRCRCRGCPNCGQIQWRTRRAVAITKRLAAARLDAPQNSARRAVHAVVSPPPGSVETVTEAQQYFRESYQHAVDHGVRGGTAIFHGFRVTDATKTAFRDSIDAGDWDPEADGGVWRYLLDNTRYWRDQVYWSPHYHIIGLSRSFKALAPEQDDGWVVKRIRTLEEIRFGEQDGFADIGALSKYLLSHATFEPDSTTSCIRWFGSLSTRNFAIDDALDDGQLSVIKRRIEKALTGTLQTVPERGADEQAPADETDCCTDCGAAALQPIWDAGSALRDQRWCQKIDREAQQRLKTAFHWMCGDIEPPPETLATRQAAQEWLAANSQ